MARSNSAKKDAQRAELRKKWAEALDLRKMGYTHAAIGEEMGVSADTAWRYVQNALKDITVESAEEVRVLELQRYDELLMAHYGNALRGDTYATQQCLAIMSRIERLYGVEGPTQQDATSRVRSMLERLIGPTPKGQDANTADTDDNLDAGD